MISEKTPEELQKYTKQMREWVCEQPNLPKDIDDTLLLRFVHSCYYDVERAKTVLNLFFTWRASSYDLLSNRDPQSPHMQKILKAIDIAHLDISENLNLWIWQINDPGLVNYDYTLDAKLALLTMDSWLLNAKHFPEGLILIMDAKDINFKFLFKMNFALASRLTKYQQDLLQKLGSVTCHKLLLGGYTAQDPICKNLLKMLDYASDLAQLEISGNRNLWIWRLNDPGLENYEYILDIKLFLLTSDSWLLSTKHFSEGLIVLLDAKDISLKFLTKFSISLGRRLSKYQQEAMPIRLKQVHIVNAPSIIDKIYAIMKPLMNKDVAKSVYFHAQNSQTLYKYLSRDDLPEDYGGTRPSIKSLKPQVVSVINSHRDQLNEHLWVAIDKKKAEINNIETGSFRSLTID